MKLKHAFLVMVGVLFLFSQLFSQQFFSRPNSTIKLIMQGEGGANGAAVVYNPDKQIYYAVFAGNAEYPLDVFDRNGSLLSTSQAGNDMRGMWWNPKKGTLEGNCYLDGGIVAVDLDDNGYPYFADDVIFDGAEHQPNEHAVGVFDPVKKEILYYSDGVVVGYSRKNGKPTKTYVSLVLPVSLENINWSTMIFTGVKDKEIGVLDQVSKKVYLFDITGAQTGTVQLPAEAPVNQAFNFSYANGQLFLFDKDSREWTGYRIFE
jgi:hypothetical protein